MQRFDCLAKDCPLFGAHLLEASAGTGKTFSIEHIYVRLVLESLSVEQILAVTFTRAATRELKQRIRKNLEKALHYLRRGEAPWEYLNTYLGSAEAIQLLSDAIATFDRCQIFTIHGFCSRMLREFAFEANLSASCPDPDQKTTVPEELQVALQDFLEHGLDENLLCLEQASILCGEFGSWQKLCDRLLLLEKGEGTPFAELVDRCKAALQGWNGSKIEETKLMEDFLNLRQGYKAVKGDLENQVAALARCFAGEVEAFRVLIKEKGTLFDFLDSSNQKVKATPPSFLHYPDLFDWAKEALSPLLNPSKKQLLRTVQAAWNLIAEKLIAEEEILNPEEILLQAQRSLQNERFASRIRQKYAAAIVDEFQDTDAVQWSIFTTLFLSEGQNKLKALYLVGDPKQSIYRFRKADVYTYLAARDHLGEGCLYQLDTNFRSSKKLLGALNALFHRDWLHLPKADRVLPYQPVRAGLDLDSAFGDHKGALHFVEVVDDGSPLFETVFLPFAAQEIERLLPECKNKSSFAVLVKDRYQAEQALQFFKKRNLPAIARSHVPLGKTFAFQALREVFEALLSLHDEGLLKVVQSGPFQMDSEKRMELKWILEKEGVVPFCRALIQGKKLEPSFSRDTLQIFEALFAWERKEGFSVEGLKRFLSYFKNLDADEGGRRQMESEEDAIQIMTLHISKGLEFEIVFALGLASRTPSTEEEVAEIGAEKLRQLYVAMTRAKRRLYVPLVLEQKEAEEGTHSPMELFCRFFEPNELRQLSAKESISFELLPSPFLLPSEPMRLEEKLVIPEEERLAPVSYTPSRLLSFTTLAQSQGVGEKLQPLSQASLTMNTMPRGTETGILIHQIFETLFTSSKPIWRDREAVAALVLEELRFSPLLLWKDPIVEMVQRVVTTPLQANGEFFSLSELEVGELQVEMEFLFSKKPHFVKGFIDLVFVYREKFYFLDWKTNWLEDYAVSSLEKAMQRHDYPLQAAIYAESLRRHLRAGAAFEVIFGGAFYFFVRGIAPLYINPDFTLIEGEYARPEFD